eukprot:m.265428 g.265428  ORF g.265428 m.265428 type:complete len:175 (-) comp19262_c0_seq1:191-715(-)
MILPVIPTASDTCTGKPVEPLNFWQYRSLHRVKASLLAVNLASFPRATIAYLYLFEREQTFDPLTRPREPLRLTFLGLVDFVLPSLPTTGPHLWVQALLLLRLLIAAHAFKWFNTNFWARWGWHDATGAPDLGWRGAVGIGAAWACLAPLCVFFSVCMTFWALRPALLPRLCTR